MKSMIERKPKLHILLSVILFLVCSVVSGQQNKLSININIAWNEDEPTLVKSSINDNEQLTIFKSEEGTFLNYKRSLNEFDDLKYKISNISWNNNAFSSDGLSSNLRTSINSYVAIASKKKTGVIQIPIIQNDNFGTHQLSSLSIDITLIKTNTSNNLRSNTVSNSVLKSGDWYKIGIDHTGVYKITYEFLKSAGLDVDNIPTANYSVFGQYGGMLPKLAGDSRIDDLSEIAIQVVSSSSTLQPGDYLIFYGEGPEKWTFNDTKERFEHENHLYADVKTYFITPNQGTGKRVTQINEPSGTAAATYSTFNDYAFIEDDLINVNRSGSDWFGDEFEVDLNKSYSLSFPNIVSTVPTYLDYRVVAGSNTSSTFNIDFNGNNFTTPSMTAVNLNDYLQPKGDDVISTESFNISGNAISINLTYNQPNFVSRGWLDYLAVNTTRELKLAENEMAFRAIDARNHPIVAYQIENVNSNTRIWDVSDLFDIKGVDYNLSGNTASFKAEGNQIRQYIAFNTLEESPTSLGKIENQDLHGLSDADMIIITRPTMLSQSNELAQFHLEQEGYVTHVVTYEQIMNEFASGTNDITSIRDFLKMFYDRNANYPRYVLLMGDGSFSNKTLEDYHLPTFQNVRTLTTLKTYTSDDFFVFLDDTEGNNIDGASNRLDMAIGRIPADNASKASIAIEKIKRYYDKQSFGSWRNVGTYVADDEDGNLHFRQTETNSNRFISDNPKMNIEKIYLDAYNQVSGSGGGSYPDVNEAINKRMFKGNLFLNYIGHGGSNGLAEEGVITLTDIANWNNPDKLALIVSATCEFTRYDESDVYSAGERSFFKSDGGAIALVTTVRVVFASQNEDMNLSFMNSMTEAATDRAMTLGDITKESKNASDTQTDGNRKFTLIGDPALRLAFPQFNVQTTFINEAEYVSINDTLQTDTLKALTKMTIEGDVRDLSDQVMTDFNGFVYPTVYDKVKTISTLGNDDGSSIAPFNVQNNIIYAGKVQAVNGQFSYTFIVPKDINYTVGKGKISYYAHNDFIDASGIDTVMVGGGGELDPDSIDKDGPQIEVFMEDDSWISGDITESNTDLLVHLFDDNGINTVGSGIGHDIEAILDNDNENAINLNDFYESDLNSYQSGKVLYPLELIPEGTHDVKVKAWDVYNNSGEGFTEFVIAETANLALEHVLNYPNPFTTSTNFIFEHNRKGDLLDVRIEVFTVSGKLVKTLQETATSENRNVQIPWDGLDDYGDKIGKGVYIYKVSLKDSSGEKVEQFQKLVLLR